MVRQRAGFALTRDQNPLGSVIRSVGKAGSVSRSLSPVTNTSAFESNAEASIQRSSGSRTEISGGLDGLGVTG